MRYVRKMKTRLDRGAKLSRAMCATRATVLPILETAGFHAIYVLRSGGQQHPIRITATKIFESGAAAIIDLEFTPSVDLAPLVAEVKESIRSTQAFIS